MALINDSRVYIGAALTAPKLTVTEADFDSVSWVEIGSVTSIPDIQDKANIVSTPTIVGRRARKSKGLRDAQTGNVVAIKVPTDAGQMALRAAERSCCHFPFKFVDGGDCCANSAVVTISVATPAVVTWASHGLSNGAAVMFSTTGALPTGLAAGTTYYVTDAASGTFELSATSGGASINTTGAGSGVHTATAIVASSTKLIMALVDGFADNGGSADTELLVTASLAFSSNPVIV